MILINVSLQTFLRCSICFCGGYGSKKRKKISTYFKMGDDCAKLDALIIWMFNGNEMCVVNFQILR